MVPALTARRGAREIATPVRGLEKQDDARGLARAGGSKIHVPRRIRKRMANYLSVWQSNQCDEIEVIAETNPKLLKTQARISRSTGRSDAHPVDVSEVSPDANVLPAS